MNLAKALLQKACPSARAFSTSGQLSRSVPVASVSQANIDKGHTEWDGSVRPLYMDAQATTPLDPRVLDAISPTLLVIMETHTVEHTLTDGRQRMQWKMHVNK